jgi:hypothetical protein
MKRLIYILLSLALPGLVQAVSNQVVLSQIGATYNRTAAEITAGVTPTNYGYPPGDVRRFGAVGNGSTDDSSAIQNALNVGGRIILPCSTFRVASGITVPQGSYLTGQTCGDSSTVTPGATLQCDLSVATCLTLGGSSATNGGVTVDSVRVTRAAGTIPANSIGVLVQNLYNVYLSNVFSQRHSIGFEFLSNGTSYGISAQADRLFTCAITDAHVVYNTWAELRITNSRFGCNGGADFTNNDFIRITGGSTSNAAAGPNTLYVANTQFNQGVNTVGCWLHFASQTPGSIADTGDLSFVNIHVETIGTAYVCSDSTWTSITRLKIDNAHFNTVKPFLSLNAATTANNWQFSNSYFAGAFSFAPASQFNFVSLSNNYFLGAVSTTGVSSSTWVSTGNTYDNGLTYAGSFGELTSVGDQMPSGSFTFTATGSAHNWANFDGSTFASGTWTPGVSFGGGTTGLTYSRQAGRYQIVGNQIIIGYSVILTAVGSSTGVAALTGLPFTVENIVGAAGGGGALNNYSNFSTLTGAVIASVNVGAATMNLLQTGSTGVSSVTNSNFTNTATLNGTAVYQWQ